MLEMLKAWNRKRVLRRRIERWAPDYSTWIAKHETSPPSSGADVLISIIMPVYRPNLAFFRAAVRSVIEQSNKNWELCIADDASCDSELSTELTRMMSVDARIKVVVRDKNGHIAAASNDALKLACGDWVCLMDQDDVLAPNAIAWLLYYIDKQPDTQFFYSDRDKITEQGERYEPYFKPGFGKEMFLAQNYLCHLTAMRSKIVAQLGGFRQGYDGAQDHDLFLRYLKSIAWQGIFHIPKILYHWRSHSGSTAQSLSNKNYAMSAGVAAVSDHFSQVECPPVVSWCAKSSSVLLEYPLPHPLPLVSIIIPTRDRLDLLSCCIESLRKNTNYANYELIVVDNGSVEPEALNYLNELMRSEDVVVIRDDGDFNFSRLNNIAARRAKGEFLLLLNNDIEVTSAEWLSIMVALANQEGVGCVGAKLLYPNGKIQHGGLVLGVGGVAAHVLRGRDCNDPVYFNWLNITHEVSAVTGACLLVSRDTYFTVGGLDEENLAVAFNDVDFCLKVMSSGYRNIYAARAVLTHHESVSRGLDSSKQSVARWRVESDFMKKKWRKFIDNDPFYNSNLSLRSDGFEFGDRSSVSHEEIRA